MKIVILGASVPGVLAWLTFPDATVYEKLPAHKMKRKQNYYGKNYLMKPIPGVWTEQTRVITHIDGRVPTPSAGARFYEKTGRMITLPPIESIGYTVPVWPETRAQYEWLPLKIDAEAKQIDFQGKSTVRFDVLIFAGVLTDLIRLLNLGESFDPTWFTSHPVYMRVNTRPPDAPFGNDVFYVNYLSEPSIACYRFCDRVGERHYEGLTSMGCIPSKKLYPGVISSSESTKGILNLLNEKDIYCVGKYGRWAPNETVNDTWDYLQRLKYDTLREGLDNGSS